jgi:hypothetical protein
MAKAEHCHACAAPLSDPGLAGASDLYCKYCTDENGQLKPRDEIQVHISHWLQRWQGEITEESAMRRADYYLRSMPAFAED